MTLKRPKGNNIAWDLDTLVYSSDGSDLCDLTLALVYR